MCKKDTADAGNNSPISPRAYKLIRTFKLIESFLTKLDTRSKRSATYKINRFKLRNERRESTKKITLKKGPTLKKQN